MVSGRATLIECTLRGNLAMVTRTGHHASGGGASIGESGTLELIGARMNSNDAGGKGIYESNLLDETLSRSNRMERAAHIDCAGNVTLVDSRISSSPATSSVAMSSTEPGVGQLEYAASVAMSSTEPGVGQLEYAASAWITGRGSGVITIRDCKLESAVADVARPTVLLRLVGSLSQSVMRGCTAVNMAVDIPEVAQPPKRFAAINSTFEPPLLTKMPAAVDPPHCSVIVAGERVCDPRAQCRNGTSGGIWCSCTGDGLRHKPGVVPDGQQCQQEARVDLHVQSKKLLLKVRKPGSERLAVIVNATGETKFSAQYSLGITHVSGSGNNRMMLGNASWQSLNDTLLSLHGFALRWDKPPSEDAAIDLDREAGSFAVSKIYRYQLRLDCGKTRPCLADGDSVETLMQIGTDSDSSSMRSEVLLITDVEAFVSCDQSQAWVERDVYDLPPQTPFRVHVTAVDVDGLAVNFTRADIAFLLGKRYSNKTVTLPVQWNSGSNEYVAVASGDLTNDDGEHELIVRVRQGWSEADARVKDCILLRRVITVIADRRQAILAGCLASVLLLAGVAVGHLLHKNRERALRIFLSFLSFEGLLLVEVLLELWGTRPPACTTTPKHTHRPVSGLGLGSVCIEPFVAFVVQTWRGTASSWSL